MPSAARLLVRTVPLRRALSGLHPPDSSCSCKNRSGTESRNSSSSSSTSTSHCFHPSRISPAASALEALPIPSSFFSTATRPRRTAFPRHGKAVEPMHKKLPGSSMRQKKQIDRVMAAAAGALPGATTTVPALEEEEEAEEEAKIAPEIAGPVLENHEISSSGSQEASSSSSSTSSIFPSYSSTSPHTMPSAPYPPLKLSPELDAMTGDEAVETAKAATAEATSTRWPSVIELGPPTSSTTENERVLDGAPEGPSPPGFPSGARKPAAMPTHLTAPPYVHHFDSYSLVKQLEEAGGYTHAQAITAMKAVRALLAQHLDVAQASLVSKSDVDNETYLFQAASAELRIEVRNNRRRADEQVRQRRALLQHEVDIAAQAVGQELVSLNDVVQGLFNDRKMAVREEQRALESAIQQLSYKIATDLNSEMRSEIEGMRWVMIWRAVLGILFMAFLTMATVRYARYLSHEKQRQAEAAPAAAATAAAPAAAMVEAQADSGRLSYRE